MMPVKLATPGFLEKQVFWNKVYDVIMWVTKFYYVTQIILPVRLWDQSLVTLAFQ